MTVRKYVLISDYVLNSCMRLLTGLYGRFCFRRKGEIGGGRWVYPKSANNMAASGLAYRNDLVGTGRAISVIFGINGARYKQSHLVGPPFPEFKAGFPAMVGWYFSRVLTGSLLIVVRVTYPLRMAEITSRSSFEPNDPTEQKLG